MSGVLLSGQILITSLINLATILHYTFSSHNWKGLAAKQAPEKRKNKGGRKKTGTRCRYRFTVPQILAPPWYRFSSLTILRFALTKLSLTRYLSSPSFCARIPGELSPFSRGSASFPACSESFHVQHVR